MCLKWEMRNTVIERKRVLWPKHTHCYQIIEEKTQKCKSASLRTAGAERKHNRTECSKLFNNTN